MTQLSDALDKLAALPDSAKRRYLARVRQAAAADGFDGMDLDVEVARRRQRNRFIWGGPLQYIASAPNVLRQAEIEGAAKDSTGTAVSRYWGQHTVWAKPLLSERQSLEYYWLVADGRPFKRDLCDLHNCNPGGVVLEYGCGIGNDLTGWIVDSPAAEVIGVDVSRSALRISQQRLSHHPESKGRLRLLQIDEADPTIPLPDNSVDRVNSLGVIHHTSNPVAILRELRRVLKPTGQARIMCYNPLSIYVHLDVGYRFQLVRGAYPNMSPRQAFEKHADLQAPSRTVGIPTSFWH